MAQASSDEVNLGAELLRMFGPDGLRGALSDEFIDELKRERARHAELAGLRDDDRRFIDEINDAILDPEIKAILVVDFSRQHSKIIRRFITEHNLRKSMQDEMQYLDGTRVFFKVMPGNFVRGCRLDACIVHESIGWKDYEQMMVAIRPCMTY